MENGKIETVMLLTTSEYEVLCGIAFSESSVEILETFLEENPPEPDSREKVLSCLLQDQDGTAVLNNLGEKSINFYEKSHLTVPMRLLNGFIEIAETYISQHESDYAGYPMHLHKIDYERDLVHEAKELLKQHTSRKDT